MKSKLLLFSLFFISYLRMSAQLELGDAVVTRSSVNSTDQVVRIYPVGITNTAHPGDNWGIDTKSYATWTAQNLGQVFGIAINTNSPHHLIYVSTSQVYPQGGTITYLNGFREMGFSPSLRGPNTPSGAVLIWELDPVTSTYTPLVRSTNTFGLYTDTRDSIFNRGTDIGNICFDNIHNQIFATNMEDGMIYRIDGNPSHSTYGNVLSRFDPFKQFADSTNTPDSARFVGLGDRLWGIGFYDNKVYFSRWDQDANHTGFISGAGNQIYSVDINSVSGDFSATPSGLYNYVDPGSTLLIDLPYFDPTWSNPVADIEFSLDGSIMMLAERTMSEAYENDSPAVAPPFMHFAHKSRVLRYDRSGSAWLGPVNNYYVGNNFYNYHRSMNADGGVDLGYAYVDSLHNRDSCELYVWATGDALKSATGWDAVHDSDFIYGLAGIPVSGNDTFEYSAIDPLCVNNSSIYQDVFSRFSTHLYPGTKAMPGDVDVYRVPCTSCHVTASLEVDDTICYGHLVILHANGGAWGKYYLDNGADESGILIVPGIGRLDTLPQADATLGTHTICFVAFSANPDSTEVWCSDTICKTFTIVRCSCDSNTIAMVHTQTGPMSYSFDHVGSGVPDFVRWYVDGIYDRETDGISAFNYTFSTGGMHIVCLEAGYIQPAGDGHGICCYLNRCDTIYINRCAIWRASDSITYTIDPFDYHTVHFQLWGQTPNNITWNFGDGTPNDYNSGMTVTHTFSDGIHVICADLIWSLQDSSDCCCLDTSCVGIDINLCNFTDFNVIVAEHSGSDYVFKITHTAGFVHLGTVSWTVDGVSQPYTGTILPYSVGASGIYEICASFDYTTWMGKDTVICHYKVCVQDTLIGDEHSMFRSYPNPTSGDMIIEITNEGMAGKTAKVDVMDVTGQLVLTMDIPGIDKGVTQNYIDISALPRGIYALRMSMDDTREIIKLVKK